MNNNYIIKSARGSKMALLRLPRGSSSGLLLLGAAGVIAIGISKSMYTGKRSFCVCVCF